MISIVIPAFNEEKYIGTILQSLVEQDFSEDKEVIVADADSNDRTREVAESFAPHFHRLVVVKGGMPAVGRNNGAKASSGDIIIFIDADLQIKNRHFLKNNVEHFRKYKLAAATTKLIPQSDKFIDHILVGFYNIILKPAVFIRPLGAMCIMASRDVFQKIGGYPEDVVMAEDHDFVLKCSKVGKYGILPVPIYMSVRRLDKEGRFGLAFKYLKASLLRVLKGPIKEFDYEFGYSEDNLKEEGWNNR